MAPGPLGPSGSAVVEEAARHGVRLFPLAAGVAERVADTVTSQGLFAIVATVAEPIERLAGARLVLVGLSLRDPGNAGTLVRSAAAAGADGVVFAGTSVDPFNPKTVRASAGAVFHLPLVVAPDPREALEALRAGGMRCLAGLAHGGADHRVAPLGGPLALVLGNEAHGIDPSLAGCVDGGVTIPLARGESLNVAVAGSILAFAAAGASESRSRVPVEGLAAETAVGRPPEKEEEP